MLRHLGRQPLPGAIVDDGRALALLAVEHEAQYLVRPDGYVAFRCAGTHLEAVTQYLASSVVPSGLLD